MKSRLLLTLTIFLFTTLTGRADDARSVDSLSRQHELHEITVKATAPRKVLKLSSDGSIGIRADMLGEQAAFMGANDPVALLRTLPAVATNNDLQAAMTVRGGGNGANIFQTDGARIVNPLHLLGLYSAFNPSFYTSYVFRAGRAPATAPNHTGGYLCALTPDTPDTVFNGQASAGIIESHGALRIPIVKGKTSLALGARTTYLNLLFPSLLTLGESTLDYRFTDLNAMLLHRAGDSDLIKLTVFGNSDRMDLLSDKNGAKDGRFGWKNLAASASWRHNALTSSLSFTRFSNRFEFSEGARLLSLPSSFSQFTAEVRLDKGEFSFGGDATYRYSSGQRNTAEDIAPDDSRASRAAEINLAADWRRSFGAHFGIEAGLRLSLYHCGSFNTIMPQPRLALTYIVAAPLSLVASYGRYVMFDRLIEETSGGLPADFRINADKGLPPESAHNFEAGVTGTIPGTGMQYSVTGYGRLLSHNGEFAGSLLDLVSETYDPAMHVLDGSGYAAGLSVTAMRQTGKIRGRIGYNYGVTRLRFERYGDSYIPSAHDRPHDLNLSLNCNILPQFLIGASFTYATGTPYTQAKYGYMIGENLICEYFPHNSSRLPDYRRLDLSASWTFRTGARLRHTVNISVYNALACRNVLFIFTDYSIDNGIRQRRSEMKSVIPSVSYTIDF